MISEIIALSEWRQLANDADCLGKQQNTEKNITARRIYQNDTVISQPCSDVAWDRRF